MASGSFSQSPSGPLRLNETLPSNFFEYLETLDGLKRREMEKSCQTILIGAGELICKQDEHPEAIFIVVSGVVEVKTQSADGTQSRSVAYLRRGDIFGEVGILAHNNRIAAIVALETSTLWRMPALEFKRFLYKTPGFGTYVATVLAGRLYSSTAKASFNNYCVDLGGSMMKFDLLLIFQTITQAGHCGELRLINPNENIIGSFFFAGSGVTFGRFAHLQGLEAVWQIFLEPAMEGSFAFQIMDRPSLNFDEKYQIQLGGMDTLMQAASMRDHFQALPEGMQSLRGRIERRAEEFVWAGDPDHQALAERLWALILKRPQFLESTWRRLDVCMLALVDAVRGLEASGLAEWVDDSTPV